MLTEAQLTIVTSKIKGDVSNLLKFYFIIGQFCHKGQYSNEFFVISGTGSTQYLNPTFNRFEVGYSLGILKDH